jgi:hypothetical protein
MHAARAFPAQPCRTTPKGADGQPIRGRGRSPKSAAASAAGGESGVSQISTKTVTTRSPGSAAVALAKYHQPPSAPSSRLSAEPPGQPKSQGSATSSARRADGVGEGRQVARGVSPASQEQQLQVAQGDQELVVRTPLASSLHGSPNGVSPVPSRSGSHNPVRPPPLLGTRPM